MKAVLLIARRDLAAYLRTFSGYFIMFGMLLVLGLFFNGFILGKTPRASAEVLGAFFYTASGFTMFGAVVFSMKLLAEERQAGTLVLLYYPR